MATETEANGVETLPSRLHRHLDLLLRIEEILREERTELLQAGKDLGAATSTVGDADELHRLRTENNDLRQLMAELEEQLTTRLERSNETQLGLEEENAELRRSMHEKEAFIEELRRSSLRLSENPEAQEAADYEAELNEFRQQLESDRQQLDIQLEQMRARNADLKEAAREAELEMSRERAQLARERAQLDRMRDEFRQEMERAQRHAGMHESLASVRKLKNEMSERNRAIDAPQHAPDQTDRAASRWRNFLPGSGNG
jgi:chromosome segregation ATPase